ncbi:MAG: hypothetical protein ACREJP_06500, partial [Candidatus Methylomirabilales bacterium]
KRSSFSYGPDGLLSFHNVEGRTTSFNYFLNGLEKNAAIFGGPWGTSSEYYPSGALKSFYLANGAFLEHRYDQADRMSTRVLRSSDGGVLSAWEEISYDENDQRTSEIVAQPESGREPLLANPPGRTYSPACGERTTPPWEHPG